MINRNQEEFQKLAENYAENDLLLFIKKHFHESKKISFQLMDYSDFFSGFIFIASSSEFTFSFDLFVQNDGDNYYSNFDLTISRKNSEYPHYYDVYRDKVLIKNLTQNKYFIEFSKQLKKHERIIIDRTKNVFDWWFNPDIEREQVPYMSTTILTRFMKILVEGEIKLNKNPNQIVLLKVFHECRNEDSTQWISIGLYIPSLNKWFIFSHIYWRHITVTDHFYLSQLDLLKAKYNIEINCLEGDYITIFPDPNQISEDPQKISQMSYADRLALNILSQEIEKSYLEFKGIWDHNSPKHKSELVKDVIALFNGSAYHQRSKKAYLILGIAEVNKRPVLINGIENSNQIKQSIEAIIREYITPIPDIDTYIIPNIHLKDDILPKIDNVIHFQIGGRDFEKREIIIFELIGHPKNVYEMSKDMIFSEPNKKYNRNLGESWIRYGEYTKRISESERRSIRELVSSNQERLTHKKLD